MPKNLVKNHFETAGIYVEGERSSFLFNKPVLASLCAGMLVPVGDPIPVFPGVKLDLALDAVLRSDTMVVPPLDGLFFDTFAVWVPHRIVWNHMPQFLGDPESVAWTQSSTYIYPSVSYYDLSTNWTSFQGVCDDFSTTLGNFSLANAYGLYNPRYGSSGQTFATRKISVLAFRGYYSIWNYLFRDENYQRPVLFSKGDTGGTGEFGYQIVSYLVDTLVTLEGSTCFNLGLGVGHGFDKAILMPVNKLHDAYTSGLPQPQFGNPVDLVPQTGVNAPIFGATTAHDISAKPIKFGVTSVMNAKLNLTTDASGVLSDDGATVGGTQIPLTYTNMVADLSNVALMTVNTFRTSVMYQRYLEALARSGRRMPSYMWAVYGVKNTSMSCDYPDLLTRNRYMLGVNQVVATADGSGSGWTSHLGDTGAYSLTNLRNIPLCEKDFTEFGYLHILCCIRADNRYSVFVQEHFTRSGILDEYNPFFDHIGDVGVNTIHVNALSSSDTNFFFQEAWWSERTQVAMCTGALNRNYGSLKYWTLGEDLGSSVTTCTPGYLVFKPQTLNDIFVHSYFSYPQFILDARIHGKKIARMSQHSIPGIVGRV